MCRREVPASGVGCAARMPGRVHARMVCGGVPLSQAHRARRTVIPLRAASARRSSSTAAAASSRSVQRPSWIPFRCVVLREAMTQSSPGPARKSSASVAPTSGSNGGGVGGTDRDPEPVVTGEGVDESGRRALGTRAEVDVRTVGQVSRSVQVDHVLDPGQV